MLYLDKDDLPIKQYWKERCLLSGEQSQKGQALPEGKDVTERTDSSWSMFVSMLKQAFNRRTFSARQKTNLGCKLRISLPYSSEFSTTHIQSIAKS